MIFLSRFSLLQQLKNDNLLQAYIVSIGNKKSPFQEDFNENLWKGLFTCLLAALWISYRYYLVGFIG